MTELYHYDRVWVVTAHTQDKGRVWFTYVWRTHIPGEPGAYASGGLYVYRYWRP